MISDGLLRHDPDGAEDQDDDEDDEQQQDDQSCAHHQSSRGYSESRPTATPVTIAVAPSMDTTRTSCPGRHAAVVGGGPGRPRLTAELDATVVLGHGGQDQRRAADLGRGADALGVRHGELPLDDGPDEQQRQRGHGERDQHLGRRRGRRGPPRAQPASAPPPASGRRSRRWPARWRRARARSRPRPASRDPRTTSSAAASLRSVDRLCAGRSTPHRSERRSPPARSLRSRRSSPAPSSVRRAAPRSAAARTSATGSRRVSVISTGPAATTRPSRMQQHVGEATAGSPRRGG